MVDVATIGRALGDALGLGLRLAVAHEGASPRSLSPAERRAYDLLAGTPRAGTWLTGRSALKTLRRALDGCSDTASLSFPNPRYSLTHSRGTALAVGAPPGALAGIGIDLELRSAIEPAAARFFLTRRERRWLESLPAGAAGPGLLRVWCVKEALFKADPANAGTLLADHELESPGAARGRARARSGARIDYASWSAGGACVALAVCRGVRGP